MNTTATPRIQRMTVASVYPHYLAKVERKGRTKDELDAVIRWLTAYDDVELARHLAEETTFLDFFASARLHPNASLITGTICGVRVEDIEDPLMQQIRPDPQSGASTSRCPPASRGVRTTIAGR